MWTQQPRFPRCATVALRGISCRACCDHGRRIFSVDTWHKCFSTGRCWIKAEIPLQFISKLYSVWIQKYYKCFNNLILREINVAPNDVTEVSILRGALWFDFDVFIIKTRVHPLMVAPRGVNIEKEMKLILPLREINVGPNDVTEVSILNTISSRMENVFEGWETTSSGFIIKPQSFQKTYIYYNSSPLRINVGPNDVTEVFLEWNPSLYTCTSIYIYTSICSSHYPSIYLSIDPCLSRVHPRVTRCGFVDDNCCEALVLYQLRNV